MAVQDIYYELASDQSADVDKDKLRNASPLFTPNTIQKNIIGFT